MAGRFQILPLLVLDFIHLPDRPTGVFLSIEMSFNQVLFQMESRFCDCEPVFPKPYFLGIHPFRFLATSIKGERAFSLVR